MNKTLRNSAGFLCFLIFLFFASFVVSRSIAQWHQSNIAPSATCQITTCHGLEISCGLEGPQICTEEYQLGDFCRQFATCELQNGRCQLADVPMFQQCKSCVRHCAVQVNPQKAFECEDACRQQFL